MEIVSESLFEVNRKPFVEEVKEGVDERSWYCNKSQIKDSLNEDWFILLNDWFDNFTVEVGDIDAEESSQN